MIHILQIQKSLITRRESAYLGTSKVQVLISGFTCNKKIICYLVSIIYFDLQKQEKRRKEAGAPCEREREIDRERDRERERESESEIIDHCDPFSSQSTWKRKIEDNFFNKQKREKNYI